MDHTLTVRCLEPDDSTTYRTLRLLSLMDSPDAFGSTWASEDALPAEHWSGRLSAAAVSGKDCPLIAELDGMPAGLVWAKVDAADPTLVNLFQMWVAPECRGHGIASLLLGNAVAWARARGASAVQLGVTCGDTPAARLYARAGFVPSGAIEPLRDGSPVLSQTMRLLLETESTASSVETQTSFWYNLRCVPTHAATGFRPGGEHRAPLPNESM